MVAFRYGFSSKNVMTADWFDLVVYGISETAVWSIDWDRSLIVMLGPFLIVSNLNLIHGFMLGTATTLIHYLYWFDAFKKGSFKIAICSCSIIWSTGTESILLRARFRTSSKIWITFSRSCSIAIIIPSWSPTITLVRNLLIDTKRKIFGPRRCWWKFVFKN